MTEEVFAGIDLHSNNVMIGIVDESGQRLKEQKLDCDLNQIAGFLEPWRPQLKSVAVESTYNWYWLVDGRVRSPERHRQSGSDRNKNCSRVKSLRYSFAE